VARCGSWQDPAAKPTPIGQAGDCSGARASAILQLPWLTRCCFLLCAIVGMYYERIVFAAESALPHGKLTLIRQFSRLGIFPSRLCVDDSVAQDAMPRLPRPSPCWDIRTSVAHRYLGPFVWFTSIEVGRRNADGGAFPARAPIMAICRTDLPNFRGEIYRLSAELQLLGRPRPGR
jgi:hypothetical protein